MPEVLPQCRDSMSPSLPGRRMLRFSAVQRPRRLLMMRFYGNMSQARIGEAQGISQMHVSRLLSRALAYLRCRR
jgi:RNA polymerase sigma factor (sigma-70 family)